MYHIQPLIKNTNYTKTYYFQSQKISWTIKCILKNNSILKTPLYVRKVSLLESMASNTNINVDNL